MTSQNLAILITPCIFRPEKDDVLKELVDIKKLISVSAMFFKEQDEIFHQLLSQT